MGEDRETILVCYGARAIGALVSALSWMSRGEQGGFNIGMAVYFLLASGLIDIEVERDKETYDYGFAAFLGGFSERFATVFLGTAGQKLVPPEEDKKEEEDKPPEEQL